MNCQRAAEVLRGVEHNSLRCTADEIEELLAFELVVEADPDDLALATWLEKVVREHARVHVADPSAGQALAHTLRETEERLKSDWYRIKASKEERAAREQERIDMRRALGILADAMAMRPLQKIYADARQLAPGARYVCDRNLGDEHYALTHLGWRVRGQLKIRLERFKDASLKAFLAAFRKAEGKMRAFATDVALLDHNVGYVRKNREQVIIGLVKTGLPPDQALGAYKQALTSVHAPDVAVTCARNASGGDTRLAQMRLNNAQAALMRAGFPHTPIVLGAAKSLLPFNPPEAGIPRFVELWRRIEQTFGRNEVNFKFVSRLMPAEGTPAEVVGRVATAAAALVYQAQSRDRSARRPDVRAAAVALASMAKTHDAVPGLVQRFRQIEHELVTAGLSAPHNVENDALECVACPGTPQEVVATVGALCTQLAQGRQPQRNDVSIAASFAKRFVF